MFDWNAIITVLNMANEIVLNGYEARYTAMLHSIVTSFNHHVRGHNMSRNTTKPTK